MIRKREKAQRKKRERELDRGEGKLYTWTSALPSRDFTILVREGGEAVGRPFTFTRPIDPTYAPANSLFTDSVEGGLDIKKRTMDKEDVSMYTPFDVTLASLHSWLSSRRFTFYRRSRLIIALQPCRSLFARQRTDHALFNARFFFLFSFSRSFFRLREFFFALDCSFEWNE